MELRDVVIVCVNAVVDGGGGGVGWCMQAELLRIFRINFICSSQTSAEKLFKG